MCVLIHCCRLAGGLAWLGVLAVGTIGEQVKTRLEVAAEKAGTTDVSDSKEVSGEFVLRGVEIEPR